MNTKLGRAVLIVEDYDKAFDFYELNFFYRKIFDDTTPDGKRFLHIAFSSDDNTGIWLLKADKSKLENPTGKQTGGYPTLVIYTDQIEKLYEHVQENGVKIVERLYPDSENRYFHCLDLYGNKLTVVELL